MGKLKRRKYDQAFVDSALAEVEKGTPVPTVAQKLGINPSMLYVWRARAQQGGHKGRRKQRTSDPVDAAFAVRKATSYLQAALENFGSTKSRHLAALALIELKESA